MTMPVITITRRQLAFVSYPSGEGATLSDGWFVFPGSTLCQHYQLSQEMKLAAETYYSEMTATIAEETVRTWEVEIANVKWNQKINLPRMDILAARQNAESNIVIQSSSQCSAGIAKVFEWVFRIEEKQFIFSPFLYFCCI